MKHLPGPLTIMACFFVFVWLIAAGCHFSGSQADACEWIDDELHMMYGLFRLWPDPAG